MIVAKATEACDIPEDFQALLPHFIFPGLTTKAEMFRMSSSLSFERAHLLAIGNIQIKCFTNACY